MYFIRRPDIDAYSVKPTATDTDLYVETSELNLALLETVLTLAEAQLSVVVDGLENGQAQ